MKPRILTGAILVTFTIVASFGLYLTFNSHTHHGNGCGAVAVEKLLCDSTLLQHLDYWQSAFTVIFVGLLLLLAIVQLPLWPSLFSITTVLYDHQRFKIREAKLPHFLQELFAQGVLNPKSP